MHYELARAVMLSIAFTTILAAAGCLADLTPLAEVAPGAARPVVAAAEVERLAVRAPFDETVITPEESAGAPRLE